MKSRFRPFLPIVMLAIMAMPVLAKPAKMRDIADTITANPILTNFAKLVQAADQGTFLSSRGPFTVFVPTDSAFAKIAPGDLAALLRPENKERLQHIVLFHIISNKRLTMKELIQLRAIFSCEGNPLTFKLTHSGVQLVSKAKVTHADIHCANGNITEVDSLLMPPEGALPKITFVPDALPATNMPGVTPVSPSGSTNASDIPMAPVAAPEAAH